MMTRIIKIFTVFATLIVMSSFISRNAEDFIGTYGVYASDPSKIRLTINADNTFYFQDFSIPENKIIVHGNWMLRGNKVVLMHKNSSEKFHDVWTFKDNGKVAKSRKGLNFYRLCKVKD
jgi:hypothetical protein